MASATLSISLSPLSYNSKSAFHNPIPLPSRQHNMRLQSSTTTTTISSTSTSIATTNATNAANRLSLPSSNNTFWQQHQQQMIGKHTKAQQQQQLPSPPPSPTRPRLSLDTSQERLNYNNNNNNDNHHNNNLPFTVVNKDDKSYLKLFSPVLVDSPVSYLDAKQLHDDKKLWENGPDAAFQKQLQMEKHEAHKDLSLT
ncbi:hypothetical protein BG004_006253 [Podila humilis]|nr:hypothetical protein BG004_006253 [Podila humilis]